MMPFMKNLKLIPLIMVLLFMTAGLHAQDKGEYERRKAKLEKEIAIIDKQLADNASRSSSLLADLTLLRKNVANRKALVQESDNQIKKINDQIYLTQKEINKMQARIDTLSAHYSKLVVSAYRNRDARVWYMYMFASENLGQAFRRFGYFRNLSKQLNNDAARIREAKAELELKKESLGKMKAEAQAVRNERAAEFSKLSKEEKKADGVIRQLKKDRRKYQNQLAAKKKEVNALNREIERLIAEAMGGGKPAAGKHAKKPAPVDMKLDAEFSKNKGKLPWPADGAVVGRFGKHFHPVYKNLELPPNNGVDVALAKGSQVAAVFDGVVKQVIVMPGYNQCVLIQHGNYFTFYCKLGSVSVKAGDKVKTGQSIGVIDTINGQTQLHFQVWQGNKPQNPETWLR
jgi:septal ring factor EnvC (AmiA/AmiB activator)